jgi:hypothetical protein
VAEREVVDVADFGAMRATAAAIEERRDPTDVWVDNAMTTVFAFFDDNEPAEYERANRVTYLADQRGVGEPRVDAIVVHRGCTTRKGRAIRRACRRSARDQERADRKAEEVANLERKTS